MFNNTKVIQKCKSFKPIFCLPTYKICFTTKLYNKNVNHSPPFFFFPILDDMVENENETLRDRVSDLEKRVHDQNDEITCLRATLADALRRINSIESTKGTLSQKRTSVTVCNYFESDLNKKVEVLTKSAV